MAYSSILALIEQGKKTFSAIYKRIYRSMKQEFSILFDLNYRYLPVEVYSQFHDEDVDPKVDFTGAGYDVIPTASPEFSSRVQRMAEAEALMQVMQHPQVNDGWVLQRYFTAVLDDPKLTSQAVADEPNMTPQMAMEQLEVEKQQFMDSMEAQTKTLDVKKGEIELALAQLKLALARVESAAKVEQTQAKTDQADFNAAKAASEVDKSETEIEKQQKELELLDAEIEKIKAEAAASRSTAKALDEA
jgi:chaperonin GroES